MEFFKETRIDFLRIRWITVGISLVVILAGAVSYYTKGGLSYGVDFAGGTMVHLKFKSPHDISKLRDTIKEIGFGGSRIQQLEGQNEFVLRIEQSSKEGVARTDAELDAIRTRVVDGFRSAEEKAQISAGKLDLNTSGVDSLSGLLEPVVGSAGGTTPPARELAGRILEHRDSTLASGGAGGVFQSVEQVRAVPGVTDAVYSALKDRVYFGEMRVIRTDMVGPQVGRELRSKGIQATIWALIGMLLYITFRFQFVYGVSVILTLTHDVLVTISFLSIFDYDMDLTVLAAILTIVGYSVNDTIVIFDRIRDNLKIMKKESLVDICNKSVNQTLSRTILTSGTVFVTVVSLFLFGGDVIHPFAFTMLVGVISGSYSTIYISCPILVWWKQGAEWRRAREVAKRRG